MTASAVDIWERGPSLWHVHEVGVQRKMVAPNFANTRLNFWVCTEVARGKESCLVYCLLTPPNRHSVSISYHVWISRTRSVETVPCHVFPSILMDRSKTNLPHTHTHFQDIKSIDRSRLFDQWSRVTLRINVCCALRQPFDQSFGNVFKHLLQNVSVCSADVNTKRKVF